MTLADPPKTLPARRRSWREHFQALAADVAHVPARKAAPDIADLLLMSTVDEKMPAPAAGSADLIDALVQESATRHEPGPESAARDSSAPNEQHINVLQREIQTLLGEAGVGDSFDMPAFELPRGTVSAEVPARNTPLHVDAGRAAAEPLALTTQVPEMPAPAAPTIQQVAPAAAPAIESQTDGTSEVTPEELAVLLPDAPAAGVPSGPIARIRDESVAPSVSFDATPDEAQLSEAEGVLAEELSNLLSDNDPAAKKAAADAAAKQAEADTIDSKLPDAFTAPVPVAVAAPTIASEAVASTQDALALSAVAGTESTPANTLIVTASAAVEEERPVALTLVGRVRHVVSDLVLMFFQLVDLPFSWISDLDRNVIGVVAFVLLLGGVVLFVSVRYAGL